MFFQPPSGTVSKCIKMSQENILSSKDKINVKNILGTPACYLPDLEVLHILNSQSHIQIIQHECLRK